MLSHSLFGRLGDGRPVHEYVLDNGLTQMAVDSYVRQVLVGCIILLAVAMSSISRNRRR